MPKRVEEVRFTIERVFWKGPLGLGSFGSSIVLVVGVCEGGTSWEGF